MKNRSLPIYHRLLNLTTDGKKRFCVFFNEFHSEVHIQRDQGESINDRNDRAIRVAVKWYHNHIQLAALAITRTAKAPAVLLLSNDVQNVQKAKENGILAYSRKIYKPLILLKT